MFFFFCLFYTFHHKIINLEDFPVGENGMRVGWGSGGGQKFHICTLLIHSQFKFDSSTFGRFVSESLDFMIQP